MPALRFNFRGVGRSQGSFDNGAGELSDAAAVLDWRNPKDQMVKADGPITVMFTDIVGSTKATQQHGDEGGQRLVRAHTRWGAWR